MTCPPSLRLLHGDKTAMFHPQTLRTGTPGGRSTWEGLAGRPTSPVPMTSIVLGTQRSRGWLALPEATWTPTQWVLEGREGASYLTWTAGGASQLPDDERAHQVARAPDSSRLEEGQ